MRVVIAFLSASAACAAVVCLKAGPAAAADLPTAPSNYPALGPGAADAAPDPWAGLSVGAGVSVWGGKGVKGGVGGETDLSYEHVFDNGLMLGVQASTGYMPYLQSGPGFSQFTGGAFAGGSRSTAYSPARARCRRSELSASGSIIRSPRISAWGSRRSFTPIPAAAHSRRGRNGAWRAPACLVVRAPQTAQPHRPA
jgi:hypothetical protein